MADRKHATTEESGPGNTAGSEEKARQAHAIISRLLALAGAPPFPGLAAAAQPYPQQQYRFSHYYPTAGAWPSTLSGTAAAGWPGQSWPTPTWPATTPTAQTTTAAPSPTLLTNPLTAPFVFPGSFR